MEYFDEYNFLHDTANADSNNPLIYSAYWKALTGKEFDYRHAYSKMKVREVMGQDISIVRSPSNKSPTSLDEIIGAISLRLIYDNFLMSYGYRWHDTLHSPKWYRILQSVIYVAGRERNFFKEKLVRDLHPLAYWIPWHIQYYLRPSIKLAPFFYLWLISVLIKKNYKDGEKQTGAISQKNIAWLILTDLKSKWWIKLIDYKKNMNDYFEDSNHPIRKHINK